MREERKAHRNRRLASKNLSFFLAVLLCALVLFPVPSKAQNALPLDYTSVFEAYYYASAYPEIKSAFGMNAEDIRNQFLQYGMDLGRRGCAEFDPVVYRAANPDLETAFGDNWRAYYLHYMMYGKQEGRSGTGGAFHASVLQAAKGSFVTDSGDVFFVDADGSIHTGWLSYEGSYYYLDRTSGVLHTGGTVNGITLNADGSAVMTDYAKEKIPVMIKAREILQEICSPEDTLYNKMVRCYMYSTQYPYMMKDMYVGDHRDEYACYDAHYANNILNAYNDQVILGGECFAETAACAYLFNELDIGTVYVEDNTQHGWFEIDGRFWDVHFCKEKIFENYFGIPEQGIYTRKMNTVSI